MSETHGIDIFWPKQMIPVRPETIKEVTRDGGERIAAASLSRVQFPPGAIVHDIGCGTGAATSIILSSLSHTISIKGTDIDATAISAYNARAESSSWPAEGIVMDANALSFPDDMFDLTIGNAMIFLMKNGGVNAVREMYRTLKPGGALILNCFAYNPHLITVRAASRATRGEEILPEWDSFESWQDPDLISSAVEKGGFEKAKVEVQQREVFVNVGDFDRHAELTWSFRGMPKGGWSAQDEERWDEAVDIVKQELRKTEGFEILEDGSTVIRFVIHVATAVK